MITDEMIKSLTDEERSVLLKLYQKISEEEFKKITEDTSDIQYHAVERTPTAEEILEESTQQENDMHTNFLNSKRSVLDSPVELIFNVHCNTYEKNNLGEIININDIFIKTYHVPLTNRDEIKEYIDAFFKKFVLTLEETAKEVIN